MKIEEVKALSDDELNIKVAESCGYTHHSTQELVDGLKASGHVISNYPVGYFWRNPAGQIVAVPNFCNDLNLIYQAEEFLTGKLAGDYDSILWIILKEEWYKVSRNTTILSSWHATARQKAEAFVMTMGEK